jgi:hypothetical protein
MLNRFKNILLLSAFSMMIIGPAYGDYWDYYGSGRDHSYSAYIDRANHIGYTDYTLVEPDYIDWSSIKQVPAPPVDQQDEFTVNIPNDHGGYTAVVIKRKGNGFTGPQGEFYPEFPKVSQLKIMYGK